MHCDWLEAGEHTQRTVAQLSQQLRRFLDDQAWLENRRIMDILHGIETKALALRESTPPGEVMHIADTAVDIELPMERPLHHPAIKPLIADIDLESGDADVDAAVLYSQIVIDKLQLARHIRQALQNRTQITLRELCELQPLQHGLAELVAYLQLAGDTFKAVVDEDVADVISWRGLAADGRELAITRTLAARDYREVRMAEQESEITAAANDLSALVILLLKGVIYQEGDAGHWHALLKLQTRVRDYVSVLGLDLALDEAEGYAFLRSRQDADEGATPKLPRLVTRRPLSFPVSMLLALLRKKLAEFDASGGDTRLVHSKFIETHRSVLAELLDSSLTPDAIDVSASGTSQFAKRYGFLVKPLRIRFRMLDPALALETFAAAQDITLDAASFARMECKVSRVFITENEINFLAFPRVEDSLLIFGAGYGFEMLRKARWLSHCRLHYWGDIDTHGFAILDQLRGEFDHAESFLMDRATLLEFELQWGKEERQTRRDLPRLNPAEQALYDDLRDNRIRENLRLEQERIGFCRVESALSALARIQ